MYHKQRVLGALVLLCLTALGASSLQAEMVTNNPVKAPGASKNPLKGFRNDLGGYSQNIYPTVVRQYFPWKTVENNVNDAVQKIRDYCDTQWASLPKQPWLGSWRLSSPANI